MSTNALQGIILLLGLFQLGLAWFTLYLDWRRPTNIVLSIYLFVFAVYSAGVIGMTGAKTAAEAAPWTWLVALAGLQVGIGLTYLTLHIFRPAWLKRPFVWIPLAILSTAPIVLVLLDGLFHTQLLYVGLDPRSYNGGYIEPAALLTTPLGTVFRLSNLIVLQFVEVIFLLYLLTRPDMRLRRTAVVVFLVLEAMGAISQVVLRPIIGASVAFTLIQFALTAGVMLAVSQSGELSTRHLKMVTRSLNPHGRSFSVRTKLLAAVVTILFVIVGVQAGISLDNIAQQDQRNERSRLNQLYNDYRAIVTEHETAAAALSTSLADRADVKALLKAGDRAGLLQLLTPVFTTLKTRYNIVHLYLENPDGTVLVRVHNPGQYGDDITYRSTAAQALKTRQTVAGLDIGPSRVGVRSVSPLFDGDQFIGLVEVGLDYDQAFIDTLRNRTGTDYRLWLSYEAVAAAGLAPAADAPAAPISTIFFYASTTTKAPTASADAFDRVLTSGRLEDQIVKDGDQEWDVLLAPIQAYPDRAIGAIEVISSRTAALTDFRRSQATILALAFGLAILAFTLTWIVTNTGVLQPLRHLTDVARRQLAGEMQARAQIETNDEFSALGDTLNTLTRQLGELIGSLEQRVADRTRQLQASAEVGRAAASILDSDQLLQTIVNLITNRFGFYYAAVFIQDDLQQWAALREATGEAGQALKASQHRLAVNAQSMVGAAIVTRHARIALDTDVEVMRVANPLLPNTRSEIALPLMLGDRVLGALDVQSTQPHAFDESSAALLQAMADQIAMALSNATQFQQTETTLQNTRNLFAASQAISTATDTDGILQALSNHITPDASRSTIALNGPLDDAGHPAYFELTATWVHPHYATLTQAVRPGSRFTPEQLPVVSSVTRARPLIVPDVNADDVSPELRTLMHRFSSEAMIALALTVDQSVLGLLVIGYQHARTFNADYIQTLMTLSNQAAVVIQNRRSLAEMQAALKQLDVVNRRLTGEAWRTYTAPQGGSLSVQDTAPGFASEATPARLYAPIVVRGEPIGALNLRDTNPDRAWSANDQALLEAVASEIAVAIDNARLLEQTEHRARREAQLNQIAQRIRQATNVEAILSIAATELGQTFGTAHAHAQIGRSDDQRKAVR